MQAGTSFRSPSCPLPSFPFSDKWLLYQLSFKEFLYVINENMKDLHFINGQMLKLIFHKKDIQNISKILKHVPFTWWYDAQQWEVTTDPPHRVETIKTSADKTPA